MEKLGCGIIGGLILGVLGVIGMVRDGHSVGEAIGQGIGAGLFVGLCVGVWLWWNAEDEGGSYTMSDRQITKLQNQLSSTLRSAANYEARGDHATAQHMRAHAAVLESQLRRLGA
jgi:hypothetical protein